MHRKLVLAVLLYAAAALSAQTPPPGCETHIALNLVDGRPGVVEVRDLDTPGVATLGEVQVDFRGSHWSFIPSINPFEIYLDLTCQTTAETLTVTPSKCAWVGQPESISVPPLDTTPTLDVETVPPWHRTVDIHYSMPNANFHRRLRAVFLLTNDILADRNIGGTEVSNYEQVQMTGEVGPILVKAIACETKVAIATADTGGDKGCDDGCPNKCDAPKPCVGDPVNTSGENVRYTDVDPLPGLSLRRTYDSKTNAIGYFGSRWFSLFDSNVKVFDDFDGMRYLTVIAPDRTWMVFEGNGGTYRQIGPGFARDARIVQLPSGGWRQTLPGGRETRDFSAAGNLVTIRDVSTGRETRITWTNGLPSRVDDSWGNWSLIVVADAATRRITQIYPEGRQDLAWRYVQDYHLQRVESPLGTWRTYEYAMPWVPYDRFRLVVARDGAGNVLSSYGYDDDSGAATNSYGPEGEIESVDVSAGRVAREQRTTVRYKNGRTEVHYQRTIAGKWRTVEVTGSCPSCGQRDTSVVFDPYGNVIRAQGADGYITTHQYDAARLRKVSTMTAQRPETCDPAQDASQCRLTTDGLAAATLIASAGTQVFAFTYADPIWPDRVTSTITTSVLPDGQNRTESVQYHAVTGQTISHSVAGWTGLPARQETRTTRTTLYDGTEGAAFAPGGDFQTSWLALAQPVMKKSVDGPRTDVNDVTMFVYYPIDSTVPAGLRGQLAAMRNALGHITRYENYDAFGNARRVVDANGVAIEMTFDALGRQITAAVRGVAGCDTTADPLCSTDLTTTSTYAGAGPLQSTRQPRGGVTSYTYDSRGRIASVSRGPSVTDLRERLESTYDPNTGKKSVERYLAKENGVWVEKRLVGYAYDTFEKLALISYSGGASTGYQYDSAGRLSSVRDENHSSPNTTYLYDIAGRMREVRQVLGTGTVSTVYGYDLAGNLTAVTDPNGNVTRFTYDDFGQLLRQESPVTGITQYTYDARGNLLTSTDARGAIMSHSYDALGRTTSTSTALGGETEARSWTYDEGTFGIGRTTSMTAGVTSTTFAYERRGLLRREQTTIAGAVYVTAFRYDEDGNRSRITYPSGRVADYAFDYAARPTSVTSGSTSIVSSMAYLPFGPATEIVFGNGTTRRRTYDTRYRVNTNELLGPAATIASYSYGYDPAGNVTSIQDFVSPGYNRSFLYDDLHRLTTANSGASLWGSGGYTYDAMGNMRTRTIGNSTTTFDYLGTTPLLASVNESGVVKAVAYDAVGNERTVGTTSYGYSPTNRLVSAGAFEYVYDGRGVRTIGPAPVRLTGVFVSPATIAGGNNATGTVTLSSPAASDTAIALSSNSSVATVPPLVTVPAGSSTMTFTVTTMTVPAPTTVTVTATFNGIDATTALTVRPPVPQALSVNPATLQGGSSGTGNVVLDGAAPAGGTAVALSSSSPNVTLPASVNVAAGQTTAAFTVTTTAVAQNTAATLTATSGGGSATAALTVTAAVLNGFTVQPASLEGGASATAEATLDGPAAPGTTVTLGSSNTSAVPTPLPVTVPAGQVRGTGSVPTNVVTSQTPVVITATRNGVSRTTVVTLQPPAATIAGLTLNPSTVIGTNDVVGTVTLTGNAPAHGTTVFLGSSSPSLASVPPTAVVAPGANQTTFTITTSLPGVATNVTITATHASVTRTATLSVQRPTGNYVKAVSVTPSQVVGPAGATGTVEVATSVTQNPGVDVLLTSSNTSVVTVPASVRVKKGNVTATFNVNTFAVTSATTVLISARYGGVVQRVQITVKPPGQATNDFAQPILCASTIVTPCLPRIAVQSMTGPARYSLYSPELQLLAETAGSTSPVKEIQYEYIWVAGEPAAQIETTTNQVHWYFNDHLGTPLLQTDNTATTVWRAEYEPYGTVYRYRAGSAKHQPLRFPGQEDDRASDASYNVFRWYRAGWGRYTQTDPMGLAAGTNLFGYAVSNPLGYIDPTGLEALPIPPQPPGEICPFPTPTPKAPNPSFGWKGGVIAVLIDFLIDPGIADAPTLEKMQDKLKKQCGKCNKQPNCPPCDPPVGTLGYRWDKVPPSKPHWPWKGDHIKYYLQSQSPAPVCKCFWSDTGVVLPPPPSPIAVPVPNSPVWP